MESVVGIVLSPPSVTINGAPPIWTPARAKHGSGRRFTLHKGCQPGEIGCKVLQPNAAATNYVWSANPLDAKGCNARFNSGSRRYAAGTRSV